MVTIFRWLIDNDKDEKGMRVLADLHDGDIENEKAREEFREIKEKVQAEVRSFSAVIRNKLICPVESIWGWALVRHDVEEV
jgi:hypothetical protein